MRRFYPLLRHLILANELCQPGMWDLEPHLLAIVNERNRHARRTHADEFAHLQQCLRLPPERTHLVTWQALLDRVKATLELAVRPLLIHVSQLSYLQPPEEDRPGRVRL